jgi:hypothetical protein
MIVETVSVPRPSVVESFLSKKSVKQSVEPLSGFVACYELPICHSSFPLTVTRSWGIMMMSL